MSHHNADFSANQRPLSADPSRRDFLVQSGAAGAALVLGWQVPGEALAQTAAAPGTEVNLWVVVQPDDSCIVRIARSEMGQGTLTGLAQLVAEELERDWAKVRTEQISPQRNFAAKRAWGEMGTGGSRGIRTSHDYVRRGGAAARLRGGACRGADALEFRRRLMGKHPKHLAVLNAAAERAGWGQPLPAGRHRGIAQFMGYGSYSAAVAEVSVSARGELKVHRMVLALDCGHVVNPEQVAAQVEGSVAYGLSAALYGEITIDKGRARELNFNSYPIMKLAEFPTKVETVLVPSHDFWGGVGEPTICVVTPCVLNAIHAATGKPVRSLPLKNVSLV